MTEEQLIKSILEEVKRGESKFGLYNSRHEGLAVIWEEFEELKKEVFKQRHQQNDHRLYKEAVQVAATALRMAHYFGAITETDDGRGS